MQSLSSGWFTTALINLLLAAVIGALLRLAFVVEVPGLDFMNALHAHSHVAMLGWGFLALYAFFVRLFLPGDVKNSRTYVLLFWLLEFSVIGMLITFGWKGYHASSIAFSTLHVVLSYTFFFRLYRDTRSTAGSRALSRQFMHLAMLFFVLSTLALWGMPVLMLTDLQGSAAYYASIQWFLHFQFNGWFVFGVLSILFKWLESRNVVLNLRLSRSFTVLLSISCLLTYALAVTWSNPLDILFWINSIGVLIQLAALIQFCRLILPLFVLLKERTEGLLRLLFGVGMICFVLKIVIQTAVVVPYIATIAYTIRNFVIAFIHLVLLGMLTHMMLGFAHSARFLRLEHPSARTGIVLFIIGFVLTEVLLSLQGLFFWAGLGFIPSYYESLFIASSLLPFSLVLILGGHHWAKKDMRPS